MSQIENLLPHSGVMILVDEILEVDTKSIKTKSVIKPSPFLDDTKFYSYQLIEIMAQTLGLYKSYHDRDSSQKVAFLIGSRKFEILKPYLNLGDEVHTLAVLSMQDESGFGVYDCEVFLQDELIARARLSVLNPSDKMMMELKNG